METGFGTYTVSRVNDESNRSLQAWNSADEYILKTLPDYKLADRSKILILNDSFGALAISLAGKYEVYSLSDSLCSQNAAKMNLAANSINEDAIHFINTEDALPESVSLVILKNPKSLNYLEYQLQLISSGYEKGIPVLAADMNKDIHSSTVDLFEHYLKDVKTSLAWKKARLIQGETEGTVTAINQYPVSYKPLEETFEVINYPNLFAHGRLDPGTAFLVANFPYVAAKDKVVDLACGDGILALKGASKWPEASFLCVDESTLAIKSAKESFEKSGFPNPVEFRVCDILEGVEKNTADLVLCNPPFHDNHSLTTATAMKMFRESQAVLKEGGELFVVSNRHLGYENQLGKMFSKAQIIKSNKKFSIIRAVK
jgi:23S rRNA (guanine1835-N2)-methyltransferase